MKQLICLTLFLFMVLTQGRTQEFNFSFEGVSLNGILTQPNKSPKGLVLIVHGSGRTNAVAQNWYSDVRSAISKAGYATYIYDKQGCGKSEGEFNINPAVGNSAKEVIAAINALKAEKVPGSETIGLWGVSRAGWINPLVINAFQDIKFWISVSGVYACENFNYLLKENLKLEGLPKDSVDLLVHEWTEGNRIVHAGGSYEEAKAATQNLRKNKFLDRFNNGHEISKDEYEAFQKTFMKEAFDVSTGQQIHIPNFEKVLSAIDIPVLAIFGELDKNVDWRITKALYKNTLGIHHKLTIKTYAHTNHNLFLCKTGGFFEFQDNELPYKRPPGYLETITQ